MILVFYHPETGAISECRDDSPGARKFAREHGYYIECAERPDRGFYVDVDTKSLVRIPARPTPAHHFDFETKEWEFNLAEAKHRKWAEIKEARGGERTFHWAGWEFDADSASIQAITLVAQLADHDPYREIEWTLADNSTVKLTAARIKDLAIALAQHVTAVHSRGRILRDTVEAAEKPDDLEAIKWQTKNTT